MLDNELAGFAIWTPPKNMRPPKSLVISVISNVLAIYDSLWFILFPTWLRKIYSPSREDAEEKLQYRRGQMFEMDERIKARHVPLDFEARSHWTLLALGVSPKYERRGIATELLQWGLTRADKCKQSTYVVASEAGMKLYCKRGFVVVHREEAVLPQYCGQFESILDPRRQAFTQYYLIRKPST